MDDISAPIEFNWLLQKQDLHRIMNRIIQIAIFYFISFKNSSIDKSARAISDLKVPLATS